MRKDDLEKIICVRDYYFRHFIYPVAQSFNKCNEFLLCITDILDTRHPAVNKTDVSRLT